MNCSHCNRVIRDSSTEYASLKPCGCVLCLHCLVIAHSKRGASPLQCPTCNTYVDGHDWERIAPVEPPMRTRNTSNHAPREIRKKEYVPMNTEMELDPEFDSFRIFLRNLDSLDQEDYVEALGDGLIYNEMYVIRPPTRGANIKRNRKFSRVTFCLNGEPAPRDYIHEKTIRALSEQVGKTHRPGRDHFVEWSALNVIDIAKNKKYMERMCAGGYDEEDRQKMFTHDATAFAVATIALERSGIFKKSANRVKIKGKLYKYDKLYSPLDGSVLTNDILKVKSIGQSRADDYATKFNIQSQNCNTRTEKETNIPEIKATSSKTKELRKRVILRVSATTEKSVDKSGTKQQLLIEIERFRRFEGIVVPDVNLSASKPVIVKTLLHIRNEVFRKFEKAKAELIRESLKGLPGTDTTREERKAEFQDHFQFPPRVLAIPRFNELYMHESL